uniref:dihydrofolate reductase n=1 Tax=Rodentolepis nana TaxID=102285 RepID=A0A0R3TLQ8_RODNA
LDMERLNIIVAVSQNGGIGKNNKLPWRIPEDMDFFNRISSTASEGKKNIAILGRLTWLSIPPKFRPLSNRINMIVSSQLDSVPEGVYLVKSFEESLKLSENLIKAGEADEVFVCGGHFIYKAALEQKSFPVRLYCTHVMKDFDCDTFFPTIDWDVFKPIELGTVDSNPKHYKDINYRFAVYDKVVQ